jgi:HEAT repeat protein
MLQDEERIVQRAAAEALIQVARRMGRQDIPLLQSMLKDKEPAVQQAAQRALTDLVNKEDIAWLVEWAARAPQSNTGQAASQLLIHLDCKLYCPF